MLNCHVLNSSHSYKASHSEYLLAQKIGDPKNTT